MGGNHSVSNPKKSCINRLLQNVLPAESLSSIWKTLRNHEVRFDELFSTTGFSSFEEYEQTLKNAVTKLEEAPPEPRSLEARLMRTYKDLKENRVEIRIHFDSKKLNNILENGYLNKAEGGEGSVQAGTLQLLDEVEGSFLGVPPSQVKGLPASSRPHYGMLGPSPTTPDLIPPGYQDRFQGLQEAFGDFVLILDPQEYEGHLTLHAGDSANTFQKRLGVFTHEDMHWEAPKVWDDLFVPWEKRTILLPYFHHTQDSYQPLKLYEFTDKSAWKSLKRWTKHRAPQGMGPSAEYFEVQVWKQIRKIKAIEVPKDAVLSPELLKGLRERGIEVRKTNWINWPPVSE